MKMDMLEKYQAAERLLTYHTRKAVLNGRPAVSWADGGTFSYVRQVREQAAADGVFAGEKLDAETGESGEYAGRDNVSREKPDADAKKERGSAGAVRDFRVTVDAKTGGELSIMPVERAEKAPRYEQETGRLQREMGDLAGTFSPNGRYELFTRDHNLVLKDVERSEETALTDDGGELLEYGCYLDIYSQVTSVRNGYVEHPLALFCPNGRYFITYRADRRKCGKLYLLKSFADSAEDLRPSLYEYPCPFVTDSDEEIPHYSFYVGDTEEKTLRKVDAPDFLYPVFSDETKSYVKWLEDSSAFYFTWLARGYQEARLYLGNPTDGSARLCVRERTDTFFNLGAFNLLDGYGAYQFSNFVTQDQKYAFWQSERSGYAHLYRVELGRKDTSLQNQDSAEMPQGEDRKAIQQGAPDLEAVGVDLFGEENKELIVQKLVRVDEEKGRIYFMANHAPDCSDPLYYQLYRVDFSGEHLTRLTPEDALHQVSVGGEAFVDTYSRVDLPPVTVLRSLDGALICELERADASDLMKLGYQIPERFTVTAADGKTPLYGILIRPAGFDPSLTYPVIDYIYGGAQLYNVPRDFTWDNGMDREIFGGLQEFAQLGFAGIILDGRGTPGRGKAIHDESFRNIHGCAGLADHVYCLRELKEKYPFLDIGRVGIWGNSGGGYATVSAMLRYPEVYQAGVASSGNYDQRMYEHSWTERYDGLYQEEVYEKGDITGLASRLSGKLLLAYGAMDDNVTMSQTLRLCGELNRYNKDYDLIVLPRMNHNVPSDLYFIRRKMDFFVRHLLGEEPPKEYRFERMEEQETI